MAQKAHYEFRDFWEFYAETQKPNTNPGDNDCSHARRYPHEYAAADKCAREGNPDIERMLFKVSDKIKHEMDTRNERPSVDWDLSGPDVDISRYLSGEPDCFFTYPMVMRPGGRVVRITMNGSFSADVEEYVVNRGAAMLALVDAIEESGYRAELLYSSCSGCEKDELRLDQNGALTRMPDRTELLVTFPIKTPGSAVDMARMSYCMCDDRMFGNHVFKFRETRSPAERGRIGTWKGAAMTPHDAEIVTHLKPDIFLGNDFRPFYTMQSAKDWVVQTLATLKIGEGALQVTNW